MDEKPKSEENSLQPDFATDVFIAGIVIGMLIMCAIVYISFKP